MNTTPKISVIVPIYNVEKYIERCVSSLFQQTLDEIEYIFVDDCSPDRSIDILHEIIKKYPNREKWVKIVRHERNQGLSSARNSGISIATGEYIAHCDSDDWMELTMLAKMYHAAIENNADCVYCDFNFVKQSGVERYYAPIPTDRKSTTINNWVNTTWTVIWNILVKRKLYTENDIKFPIGIKYCEDFYVGIQLFCHSSKIVHLAEPLHNYNMLNSSSILHTESKNEMNNDAAKVYLEIIDFLKRGGFFELCGESVSWRFLDGMQYCVLDELYFNKFKTLHPETHRHIMSCPYINKKIKALMWCLDKNLDFISYLFVKLRKFLKH